MLYELAQYLESHGFSVLFSFITTRAAIAFIMAFLLTLLIGRPIIHLLFKRGFRNIERTYGVISTESKNGTPTMGGIMMLLAGLGTAALWCDMTNPFVLFLFFAALYFAAMGAIDDYAKVKGGDADKGLSRKAKYLLQILFGTALGLFMSLKAITPLPVEIATELYLPFIKAPLFDLGYLYIPFAIIMIVYSANAVNFADGLDGLTIVPSFFLIIVLAIFSYVLGNVNFSEYLLYTHLPGVGEMTIFFAALGGAAVGFLWFNAHPAEIFMGDTGSLFLGGVLGTAAVLLKQEFLFLMAGGFFVLEIVSSGIQTYLGLSGKVGRRIFTRAPIHHVYQNRGIAESKIVTRFWIVSALLAVFAIMTMKIR